MIKTRKRPRKGRKRDYWALVMTLPKRERWAKLNIERRGYRTFLPQWVEEGKSNVEVLFPGYLFVLITDEWYYLKGTFGVTSILMHAGMPARVPHRDMAGLLEMCDADDVAVVPTEKFRKGQTVKIKKGSFKDQLAVYIRGAPSGRVRLLLSLFGTKHELEFDRDAITAGGPAKQSGGVR